MREIEVRIDYRTVRRISSLVATMALLGCDLPLPRPQGALDVMRRDSKVICRVDRAENRSPSDLENQLYLSRFDVNSDLVVWPIDIACVSNRYSLRRAKVWAQNGDPVAQYIVLYKTYKTDKAVCQNSEKIIRDLNRIASAESPNMKSNKILSRVPEAAYLAIEISARCNGGSRGDIVAVSVRHGFNPGPMLSKID